jgi:amino-acid N-acetyltransferase
MAKSNAALRAEVRAMIIESATLADTPFIVSILISNKSDPGLFQERIAEVRKNFSEFLVARDANGRVVACSGLHRDSSELAEVYGVAVLPELQGQGIGGLLIQKCKERAVMNQLTCLWLATVKPEYFRRYSFCPMSRWSLPTSVLFRKFRQVFQQPVLRWIPALFGRHTFMRCNLLDQRASDSQNVALPV